MVLAAIQCQIQWIHRIGVTNLELLIEQLVLGGTQLMGQALVLFGIQYKTV